MKSGNSGKLDIRPDTVINSVIDKRKWWSNRTIVEKIDNRPDTVIKSAIDNWKWCSHRTIVESVQVEVVRVRVEHAAEVRVVRAARQERIVPDKVGSGVLKLRILSPKHP